MHIPRQLKTSINRLAHSEGIRHESRIKALLIERLEAMREAGATEAELLAYLATWQQPQQGGEALPAIGLGDGMGEAI